MVSTIFSPSHEEREYKTIFIKRRCYDTKHLVGDFTVCPHLANRITEPVISGESQRTKCHLAEPGLRFCLRLPRGVQESGMEP